MDYEIIHNICEKIYKQPTSTSHLGNPYIGLQQAIDQGRTHVKIRMDTKTLEYGNKNECKTFFQKINQ